MPESAAAEPTLFQQVLGASFEALPQAVQRFHGARGHARYLGQAEIKGPSSLLARMAHAIAGFPPPGINVPVRVEIEATPKREIWVRHFGAKRFQSQMVPGLARETVEEHVGVFHFTLDLKVAETKLHVLVQSCRLFGVIPLPPFLLPHSASHETEDEAGRFVFDIDLRLPSGARIVAYRGWLEPDSAAPSNG